MHAIKYKHKVSPPALLDILPSNTHITDNIITQNNISKTQEPLEKYEIIVSTHAYNNKPSTSAAGLNNIYTNPKKI